MKITAVTHLKHAALWAAVKQLKCKLKCSLPKFCESHGLSKHALYPILSLRQRPTESRAMRIEAAFAQEGISINILETWPQSFHLPCGFSLESTKNVENRFLEDYKHHLLTEQCSPSFDLDEERLEVIREIIEKHLDDRGRFVITKRLQGMKHSEIGKLMNLSAQAVSNIQNQAVRLIRYYYPKVQNQALQTLLQGAKDYMEHNPRSVSFPSD